MRCGKYFTGTHFCTNPVTTTNALPDQYTLAESPPMPDTIRVPSCSPVMTRFERMMADMTVEKMAGIIDTEDCGKCAYGNIEFCYLPPDKTCHDGRLAWLSSKEETV
jgi:hypothetical protein